MKPVAKRIAEIVAAFPRARIAVAGDFMTDIYLEAEPQRLSREAPVMIASWRGETSIPGGAANAVNNLLALGAAVHPVGILGDDAAGLMLSAFFRDRGLQAEGVVVQPGLGTVSKTRVMLGEEGRMRQQVLRIDREPNGEILPATRRALAARFEGVLDAVDAVLFSDYGYQTVDGSLRAAATKAPVLVAADSRYALRDFRGVDVVTPNGAEASELLGRRVYRDDEVLAAARQLRDELDLPRVVITRGNQGMLLLDEDEPPLFLPAAGPADEVTDVSGAGDTVIALLTLARVAGASWAEAAWLANVGAGVVVTKLGAATLSPEELVRAATREA
ncbi:MAG: bifunctional hydroxymethylpyrimidine kinase/phosphomethylpyrimidine kinase [Planctomycetes bacterium]|nr:bifunctional hydroxymethylpyrimidine kinase/phosphomethylpyrimidine kinase [Planctomycetota bacterium]